MNFNNIEFSISKNIARITLNRPDAGNTLNIELAKELYKATNIVSTNNNIKVLILKGKGKLFCGGGDLKFLLSNEDKIKETLLEMTHYFHGAIARMTRMEAPVIIGINGTAGGGGFSLAITGDIIYSVKSWGSPIEYTFFLWCSGIILFKLIVNKPSTKSTLSILTSSDSVHVRVNARLANPRCTYSESSSSLFLASTTNLFNSE